MALPRRREPDSARASRAVLPKGAVRRCGRAGWLCVQCAECVCTLGRSARRPWKALPTLLPATQATLDERSQHSTPDAPSKEQRMEAVPLHVKVGVLLVCVVPPCWSVASLPMHAGLHTPPWQTETRDKREAGEKHEETRGIRFQRGASRIERRCGEGGGGCLCSSVAAILAPGTTAKCHAASQPPEHECTQRALLLPSSVHHLLGWARYSDLPVKQVSSAD